MDFATDDEIIYAHDNLLAGKPYFDNDKIAIIKCNHTKDIKACPGSGKTTTLLAKLVILANRMPLANNQGICVLTHTNVAIDEIKDKLGHKADILFKYPNFFGTIQAFVDKFLANPALHYYYDSSLSRVDNDIANENLLQEFNKLPPFKDKLRTSLFMRSFEVVNEIPTQTIEKWETNSKNNNLQNFLIQQQILNKKGNRIYLNEINSRKGQLTKKISDQALISLIYEERRRIEVLAKEVKRKSILQLGLDFVNEEITGSNYLKKIGSDSAKSFLTIKENLFNNGILCFSDAYSLGLRYCYNFRENLKLSFSSRFKYLFIDEMQDTDKHQINLIDTLFNNTETIIQRFGDPSQAIFQNEVSGKETWNWQPKDFFPINTSKRFGDHIAEPLKTICVENNSSLISDKSINSLHPILIVYENTEDVLPKFSEILLLKKIGAQTIWDFVLSEKAKGRQANIKAIGWRGSPKEGEITLNSYFSNYNKTLVKKDKIKYNSLASYIVHYNNIYKAKFYVDKIIEVLCYILKEFQINGNKRYLTRTSFIDKFKEQSEEKYLDFRIRISQWVKDIQDKKDILDSVKEYILNDFSNLWHIDSQNINLNSFLNGGIESDSLKSKDIEISNIYKDKKSGIEYEVATVHSVKGETHIATLYLETYHNKGYESKRILSQMFGFFTHEPNSLEEETLKVAYVAMSRPQYLLCFAVKKEHIKNWIEILDINNKGIWEIIYT